MIHILVATFAGLVGLAFGSFLNVCLSRWPLGESVVTPRSHCRTCDRALTWWENVPLLSWLALRGRCRTCGSRIAWRYPLIELAIAALWADQGWRFVTAAFGTDAPPIDVYTALANALAAMLFCWLLVALSALDAEHLWLPDWLTLPGTAAGFLFALLIARIDSLPGFVPVNILAAAEKEILAILVAAGIILAIRWTYWLIRRKEGLGLGDAKLMALLAAWLGLPGALLAFGVGVVLGAAAALVLLLHPAPPGGADKWAQRKLPLGTFLCIGGIVSSLWGEPIIAAYLRWAGL